MNHHRQRIDAVPSFRTDPWHNPRCFVCSVQITLGCFGQGGSRASTLDCKARWATEGQAQSSSTQTSHIPPWPLLELHNWNPYFYVACQLIAECIWDGGRAEVAPSESRGETCYWNEMMHQVDPSFRLVAGGLTCPSFCVTHGSKLCAPMNNVLVIRLYKVKMSHLFIRTSEDDRLATYVRWHTYKLGKVRPSTCDVIWLTNLGAWQCGNVTGVNN